MNFQMKISREVKTEMERERERRKSDILPIDKKF